MPLCLALAQIVICGADGLVVCAVGIEPLLGDSCNATIVTHFDDVDALGRSAVHPVLAFELCHHAIDRALDAERLAAADAAERLFLLEDAGGRSGGVEIELRS